LAPLQSLCDASSSSLQHAASRDFQSIDDILLHQVHTSQSSAPVIFASRERPFL
jgi:hypothetical protein